MIPECLGTRTASSVPAANVIDSSAWLEYLANGPNAIRRGLIIVFDDQLAVDAAVVGRRHGLALADSVVYATVLAVDGMVWTQDEDFQSLAQVEYRAHARKRE